MIVLKATTPSIRHLSIWLFTLCGKPDLVSNDAHTAQLRNAFKYCKIQGLWKLDGSASDALQEGARPAGSD